MPFPESLQSAVHRWGRRLPVLFFLLALTLLAVLVHGYHPAVEDGEIYLPGIKKALHPDLYPVGAEFFMSHANRTFFDELLAASIRITHVPFDYAILLWHLAAIFVLLWAGLRLSRLCFTDPRAQWAGVALVAALLTIPVAGTALLLMDQYVTTRALSTPAIMMAVVCAMERKFVRAALWAIFTAAVHPLMVVFGVAFLIVLWFEGRRPGTVNKPAKERNARLAGMGLIVPPVSDAYREVLDTRSYFFLLRWRWYEWLGIVLPFVLLWGLGRYGKKQGLRNMEMISRASLKYGVLFLGVSLVLTVPDRFAGLTLLQPLRSLHLLYIILFILLGGVIGQEILKSRVLRWLLFFLPLCCGMFYAARQTFPATPHLEFPWVTVKNEWVKAFDWIRENTPRDAVFALDPNHMALPGEDQHGFRAVAERSMLADAVKDSGAVTMFPALAEEWREQVRAQQGWEHFGKADFHRLRQKYGVSWVVLENPGIAGLDCPYRNGAVSVCPVE